MSNLKNELVSLFTDKQQQQQQQQQHIDLSPLEKYKICVNVLAVQSEERVAPLLQDALHWRNLINASHHLHLRNNTVKECSLLECQSLYKALHQAGHTACAITPEAWMNEFERQELCLKRQNREKHARMVLNGIANNNNNVHNEAHDEALGARLLEHYRRPISSVVSLCRTSCAHDESGAGSTILDCCETYLLFNALFTVDYAHSARQVARDYHEARCSNLCQRQASPLHCFNSVVFFCSGACRNHYVALLDAM